MTAIVLPTPIHNLQYFPSMNKRPRANVNSLLPNIAPRFQTVEEVRQVYPLAPATIALPRPRLPPRSRFGCWTCRTRKVKCDEARPECTPCARLGHTCDYNPRVTFKDDTPRVVRKVSGRGMSALRLLHRLVP